MVSSCGWNLPGNRRVPTVPCGSRDDIGKSHSQEAFTLCAEAEMVTHKLEAEGKR